MTSSTPAASAHRVSFVAKDGKPSSATFPNKALADAYARTVKNAKVEPVDAPAVEVQITKCPEGTVEAQKAASRDYYLTTKAGQRYIPAPVRAAEAAENRAERMAEHFFEARVVGMTQEDAWADWDHQEGIR